jgi:hypothetical protein
MSERLESMDSGEWQRLNEVFAAALEVAPEKQGELLRHACNGDERLQREAEGMLLAARQAEATAFSSRYLRQGAGPGGQRNPPGTLIGRRVVASRSGNGRFTRLREGFHQQVAQIIKRGMDTRPHRRRVWADVLAR